MAAITVDELIAELREASANGAGGAALVKFASAPTKKLVLLSVYTGDGDNCVFLDLEEE